MTRPSHKALVIAMVALDRASDEYRERAAAVRRRAASGELVYESGVHAEERERACREVADWLQQGAP